MTSQATTILFEQKSTYQKLQAAEALVGSIYAAFNARDINLILTLMRPDVDWPNGWEGGRISGHAAVRDYWERQWLQLDPEVKPVKVRLESDKSIVVLVRQTVRDKAGAVITKGDVLHRYWLLDGLISRMQIG